LIRFDDSHIAELITQESTAALKVYTLGRFNLRLFDEKIPDNWGRDKSIQLFQFFIISRNRTSLHKEIIIDRLWDGDASDQQFKVALHGINKVLSNTNHNADIKFFIRQGSTYTLNMDHIWLDSHAMESYIKIGNNTVDKQAELALIAYQKAIDLYQGIFLPNRIYEDWTTAEREKLQMLALNAHINLAELLLDDQPDECIRITEKALDIDPTWEEAYRIQMTAHMVNGNRPQAIRTFQKCKETLDREFGLEPLPDTVSLLKRIESR